MKHTDYELGEIDPNNLEDAWLAHENLVGKFADMSARAKYKLENLEAILELLSAELDKRIRRNPGRFGIKRIAEKAIHNTIVMEEEYQLQLHEVQRARLKVNLIAGVMRRLEHRKYALQEIWDQRKQVWNGEPYAGADSRDAIDMMKKKKARSGLQRKYQENGISLDEQE